MVFDGKPDWKLIVALILHALVVGAMYGRIATEVSQTEQGVLSIKKSIDEMRSVVDASNVKIATLAEGRIADGRLSDDLKLRIQRVEEATWPGPRRK